MSIVLFAILGAVVDAPAGFWITYGILSGLKVILACAKVINEAQGG